MKTVYWVCDPPDHVDWACHRLSMMDAFALASNRASGGRAVSWNSHGGLLAIGSSVFQLACRLPAWFPMCDPSDIYFTPALEGERRLQVARLGLNYQVFIDLDLEPTAFHLERDDSYCDGRVLSLEEARQRTGETDPEVFGVFGA